jgi:hypothetical protein
MNATSASARGKRKAVETLKTIEAQTGTASESIMRDLSLSGTQATMNTDKKEYSFVHNPKNLRDVLWLTPVLFIGLLAKANASPPVGIAIIILALAISIGFALSYRHILRRQRITIGVSGIAFNNIPVINGLPLFSPLPSFISWDMIHSLRHQKRTGFLTPHLLILRNQYKLEYRIPIGYSNWRSSYTGENHTLSLIEAIETFHGPLQELTEGKSEKTDKRDAR